MNSNSAGSGAHPGSLAAFRERLSRLTGSNPASDASVEGELAIALLETAQVIVLILDVDKRVCFANSYFEQLTGYRFADIEHCDWFELCILGEDRAEIDELFVSAIAGKATRGNVNPIRGADGALYSVEWFDRVIRNSEDEAVGLLAIGHNATERTDALRRLQAWNEELEQRVTLRTEELNERNQLLEGSFDASTVALAYLDPEMRFRRVNKAYAAADNKEPEFFVGKHHFELYPHEENEKLFAKVRDTGEAYSVLAKPFEYDTNPERGVTHWDWTLTPVKDGSGVVNGLVLALRDVTARVQALEAVKESEALLEQQLELKNVLLQEIHHRVKNNLQVVSSLLYLQGERVRDAELSRHLLESRNRVQAMALVHETLYSSGEPGMLDFEKYLRLLTAALCSSFSSGSDVIDYQIECTAPVLELEAALSCGLIVSELVTNALKYAFAHQDSGHLHISLVSSDNDQLCLEVSDDGIGIDDRAIQSKVTLGLTLVRAMADQLGGKLAFDNHRGTRVRVVFPKKPMSAG